MVLLSCIYRLQLWLDELCSVSIDPSLHVVWSPDPSFTVTTAHLVLTDSLASSESSKYVLLHWCVCVCVCSCTELHSRYSVKLMLEIDVVTVCRVEECGGNLAFPLQREKLIDILKHEVRNSLEGREQALGEGREYWRGEGILERGGSTGRGEGERDASKRTFLVTGIGSTYEVS